VEGGGHYKKYYSCIRAIGAYELMNSPPRRPQRTTYSAIFSHHSYTFNCVFVATCPVAETVFSTTLAAHSIPRKNWTMELVDTEHWPYFDYSLCGVSQAESGEKRRDEMGLVIRWAKDWRLKVVY